jgi:predicted nucleotidyltransferase
MIKTQEEVISFLREHRNLLHEKYAIKEIALFGSFARNEQQDDSDIDLLIELQDGTQNIHDLKEDLRIFLVNSFERSVDLARFKYLKPYAKKYILKDILYV